MYALNSSPEKHPRTSLGRVIFQLGLWTTILGWGWYVVTSSLELADKKHGDYGDLVWLVVRAILLLQAFVAFFFALYGLLSFGEWLLSKISRRMKRRRP